MAQVDSQQAARADVLSVGGVEGVTEAVVPGPQVVDVGGPPLLLVRQVGGVGGKEHLAFTFLPAQPPPPLGCVSDIHRLVVVFLRIAVLVHRVHCGAVEVGLEEVTFLSENWKLFQTFVFVNKGKHAGLVWVD